MSGAEGGFQRQLLDMSDPQPGHVWVSETLTGRFAPGAIKGPPTPSQLGWPLALLANTLKHPLLSSNSLSLKLPSNLSFLREI
jgi:hypothetical protein